MTNSQVILRRSILTFGAQILVAACSVINNFLIARALGPQGKGAVYLVFLLCNVIVYVAMSGLDQAMIYHLGRKLFSPEVALGTVTTLAIVGSGLCISLCILAPSAVRQVFVRGLDRPLEAMVLIGIAPMFVTLTWTYFTLALNHVRLYNFLRYVAGLSYTPMLVFAYFLLPHSATIFALLWVASLFVTFILAFVLVSRILRIRLGFDAAFARKGVAFGLKTHLGTTLQFFNYRLDAFMVNYWWGGSQLGLYSVAVALAEILWFIPTSASTVIGPEVPRRDPASASELTSWACRNVLWVSAAGAILLHFIAGPLIAIALPSFMPSIAVMDVLLPGVVAICITRVITSDLIGRGKPMASTYIAGATACLAAILYLWLIPRFGMWGAALASSIIYAFSALLSLVYFVIHTKVSISQVLIPRASDFHRIGELYTSLRAQLISRGQV